MRKCFLVISLLVTSHFIVAQSSFVPKRTLTYELFNRYRVLYGIESDIVPGTNNYMRNDIAIFANNMQGHPSLSSISRQNVQYLIEDNTEHFTEALNTNSKKVYIDTAQIFYALDDSSSGDYRPMQREPILSHFYKEKATFLEIKSDHFILKANPVLNIGGGFSADTETNVFQNVRGADIRGIIDNKVYFYTSIFETQRAFLNFQNRRINNDRAIPGNGLYKSYNSRVAENITGFDYLNAQAYIGLPVSQHISLELGHGNHFWGNGYRSLLLSDHAHNYFYLKLNTRVGKFQLQNIFAELAAVSKGYSPGDVILPKKYFASHYLTFSPNRKWSISLFESVVFSRENQLELQYLNPVILYRSVEHFIGSPDNVLLGMNMRWDIKNRITLHGQLILDEFKIDELTAGNGWWANKYGYQAGIKYYNAFGIDHFDLLAEYNTVRPFTYSHRTSLEAFPSFSTASYSHFSQPLAHPLGANFEEVIIRFRYQPSYQWTLYGKALLTTFGGDVGNDQFGGNILLNNSDRNRNYGFTTGEGDVQDILALELQASYMFAHNYFIDFIGLWRQEENTLQPIDTKYAGVSLRANLGRIPFDY